MKRNTAVLAIAAFVLAAGIAQAQVRDETILTYQVISEEWGDLIGGALDLTDQEAAAFVPLYKEYGAKKRALWEERIDLIKMFLAGYDTMGPEIARGLLDATFEIDAKMLALERTYADKFDDVLPLNKVVRLFQAENKLETTLMAEIVKDVPLAK